MKKSIMDRLIELKESREVKYTNFFNDGSISFDDVKFSEKLSKLDSFEPISDVFYKAAESYSSDAAFDSITMYLLLGLVYDKDSLNEDNSFKTNAKPYNNIVRYYTGSVKSYQGQDQTNELDWYKYGYNRQGYIRYDELVKTIKQEGLIFNGPETFEEFKNLILSKKPFEISFTADLKQEMKLSRKK